MPFHTIAQSFYLNEPQLEHKCNSWGHSESLEVELKLNIKKDMDTKTESINAEESEIEAQLDMNEESTGKMAGATKADLVAKLDSLVKKRLATKKDLDANEKSADTAPFSSKEDSKTTRNNCLVCGSSKYKCPKYYSPRLSFFYERKYASSAIWNLGQNGSWMLRDEGHDAKWKNDYLVQQYIRAAKVNVPLVEMHRFSGPNDKYPFTIMSRAKGKTVASMWRFLSSEQQNDVKQDIQRCLKELRKITSPTMRNVDGSELLDRFVGCCSMFGYGCVKTGINEEEWIDNLTPTIHKAISWETWSLAPRTRNGNCFAPPEHWVLDADSRTGEIRDKFPKGGGPYVLTHGDLNQRNIFISDDNITGKFKVSAIIDWETAAFYPWWVEDYCRHTDVPHTAGSGHEPLNPEYDAESFSNLASWVSTVNTLWQSLSTSLTKHIPDQRSEQWYRQQQFPDVETQSRQRDYQCHMMMTVCLVEGEHVDACEADFEDSGPPLHYSRDTDLSMKRESREFLKWYNKQDKFDFKSLKGTSAGRNV